MPRGQGAKGSTWNTNTSDAHGQFTGGVFHVKQDIDVPNGSGAQESQGPRCSAPIYLRLYFRRSKAN